MKQHFKLLTLALGLLMGVTMTSCLGDEGEPMDGRFGVVAKVYSSYFTSFRTPGETPILITPTESSINAIENNNAGFSGRRLTFRREKPAYNHACAFGPHGGTPRKRCYFTS